jgi:hypothetical protein
VSGSFGRFMHAFGQCAIATPNSGARLSGLACWGIFFEERFLGTQYDPTVVRAY